MPHTQPQGRLAYPLHWQRKALVTMAINVTGFADGLVRCLDFESVRPEQLEPIFAEAPEPFDMRYVTPSAEAPLIDSGERFTHLVFVQHGTLVPWQSPYSELSAPFLIGVHEFLMHAERWVASYSAVTDAVVVHIPRTTMTQVVERLPVVRERMHALVMRRLARFYWTSLATSGAPRSRVAAALVSRLALTDEDFGRDRRIEVKQIDIARLTTMSRSAVAAGLGQLAQAKVVRLGDDGPSRFAGVVLVPDVKRLKEEAFRDVRQREIQPLLAPSGDD